MSSTSVVPEVRVAGLPMPEGLHKEGWTIMKGSEPMENHTGELHKNAISAEVSC